MCLGVEFLTINVLLHTKSEQKVFKNPLKPGFSIRNILLQFVSGRVWVVIVFFLLEKQTFNGLLKVIGIPTKYIHDFLKGLIG